MSLKIQEQSELNFVSRIIQWPLAMGNCPTSAGLDGGDEAYYKYIEEADNPDLRWGRLCQQK
jgi:hypothetical protein